MVSCLPSDVKKSSQGRGGLPKGVTSEDLLKSSDYVIISDLFLQSRCAINLDTYTCASVPSTLK